MKSIRNSRFDNINEVNALLYKVFSCVGMLNVTLRSLEISLICGFISFKCQCCIYSVVKAVHCSLGVSNVLLFNPTESKILFMFIVIKIKVYLHWQQNNVIFHLNQCSAITKLTILEQFYNPQLPTLLHLSLNESARQNRAVKMDESILEVMFESYSGLLY